MNVKNKVNLSLNNLLLLRRINNFLFIFIAGCLVSNSTYTDESLKLFQCCF